MAIEKEDSLVILFECLSRQGEDFQACVLNDILDELNIYLRMTMKWQGRQEALAA